ncbi:hypothetical protein [Desulfosporosinus nitroreducens]|uniref:hypothetical protein n=1 Tax=Desulfosporosinus nitroreducens TaxID=2018668 RepID=UPI00207D5431|nr:hypothetical protein [Desulfosporosinus nitroreducens]MCO1604467.1 hypothetical protein [Desulfosporosinus nitroreducens]
MLTTKGESTDALEGSGSSRSSDESIVMRGDQEDESVQRKFLPTGKPGGAFCFLRRFLP